MTTTTSPRRTAADDLRLGVVSAFPPSRGSLTEYGYHLVTQLAAQPDVSEVVLYADRTDAGSPEAVPGVVAAPCWEMNGLGTVVSVLREVRRTRPDAVVFNLQFATFGDTRVAGGLGLLTPWLVRLSGTPVVVLLHNLVDTVDFQDAGFAGSPLTARLMRTAGRLLTRALLRADLVALTIPRYVELVRESYRADNVVLAPHGSFTELATAGVGVPDGPRQVMAFGKWGTYKTVDVLVEAYRLLLERGHDDLELVLAGTDSPNSAGYMAGVAERFADLPGLRLTGYVAEEDVPAVFGAATVVAFPYTSTTGSSGVLHQAGEHGRAAVLPRIGDLVDVIEEEGFRGVYFTPGDAASLADALAAVLDDAELRETLGRTNFAAAAGIPIAEVAHWYTVHVRRVLEARARGRHSLRRLRRGPRAVAA